MATRTLMELTERRELLLTLVEQEVETDDEVLAEQVREELANMLAVTEGDWRQKVDDYVAVYRSLKARAKALKDEARHLTDMARAVENQADRLRERVVFVADQNGWKKLKGHKRTITVSESGFSVHVDGEVEALPEELRVLVPATWRPDRKAIADHIKAGGEVPEGVRTEPTIRVTFR